jgi:hypothetical protein
VASRVGDDHAGFVADLIATWFYTESEAKKLSADRKTWMAVPILNKNKNVLVVVYLDSAEQDTFSDSAIELVINGCIGIASYISQHYSLQVVSALLPNTSPSNHIEKVVEVSAEGASLKEKQVVLTGDAERELTSTVETLSPGDVPPKT